MELKGEGKTRAPTEWRKIMAKLLLEIEMDNAAFEEDPSQLQALFDQMSERAYRIQHDGLKGDTYRSGLKDINGNTIGKYELQQ